MRQLYLAALLVLFVGAGCAYAMPPYLELYTQADGLGGDSAHRVCIDREGKKWFGLSGKFVHVSSFDEVSWESFSLPTSNWLTDMALDSAGRIWVVSTFGGNWLLQDGKFQTSILPQFCIFSSALTFDLDWHLWVGGWNNGLWVAKHYASKGWETWFPLINEAPWAFALGPEGRVWFVTSRYLYGSREGETSFETFYPWPGKDFVDMAVSNTGRIWLISGSCNGFGGAAPIIYSDDAEEWSVVGYPELSSKTETGTCVAIVGDTGIWFGFNAGAFWYDCTDWRWIDLGDGLADIAVDETNGDVWFATWSGAVVMRGGPDAWPPVYMEISPIQDPADADKRAFIMGDIWFEMDLNLDFYLAVEDAHGNLLFAPQFTPEMRPMAQSFDAAIGTVVENYPLLELDLSGVPEGSYRWFAACTHAGTMEFASNIASCEWQFNR